MKSSYYCGRNKVGNTVRACHTPKTCWHWPSDGNLVRCTDDNKVYKYIDSEKKLYLLDDQNFTNNYNRFWAGNGGKSDCNDSNWGSNNSQPNRKPFSDITTVPDGTTVRCFENDSKVFYRWINGTLMTFPNESVATSWDKNWKNSKTYKCNFMQPAGTMANAIPDGTILKCDDTRDNLYRYDAKTNKVVYYPKMTDAILRQYNNYSGSTWNSTMFQTQNCLQYSSDRPNLKETLQPLTPDVADGTPMVCYNQDGDNIYRYTKGNDSLSQYANPETANTWDTNYTNHKMYECSRIWQNNSGSKFNLIPCKPSDGTIVKCSEDNKLYRYAATANSLLLYETPAIAKQYSTFQTLQQDEFNTAINKTNFVVVPSYDGTKPPTYTLSLECRIERVSNEPRNILSNAGNHTANANNYNHRPSIMIVGNKIQIFHSTTNDPNASVTSNFNFTPGEWFKITIIVNRATMFTYFNNKKDVSLTGKGNFTWNAGSRSWLWNTYGASNQGFVLVKNAYFWPFVMALDWPNTFDPIEMIDEMNPYTNKPTGTKIPTTTIPPALNTKAFIKPGITFIPTTPINPNAIKNGETFICKGQYDKKFRYISDTRRIYEYAADGKNSADAVAQSWDPNYKNYKGYDCSSYVNTAGKMELKPPNNSVVKCTDDNKSYRYVNDTNSLEWYMNDNIIKQYNQDWLITDRLTKNCEQYKPQRTTFIPTQSVDKSTTSLHDGTALKCDNKPEIYRYNSRYDVLMKYPDDIIATSWDPTAVDGYYSYTCKDSYIVNQGEMQERPRESTIIKCNNSDINTNGFYYIYNFKNNTLKPKPSVESIKETFPSWDINNIYNNDCRQYSILEPRFFDDSNGKGNVTKVTPSNYGKCNPLPYNPTDVQNRSMIRDGEQILLYTDPSCNNIYTKVDSNKEKDKAVNITYSSTNAYGDVLTESNPSHYRIVSDDVYNAQYNLDQAPPLTPPPPMTAVSGQVRAVPTTGTTTTGGGGGSNNRNLISEAEYYAKYGISMVNQDNIDIAENYAKMGLSYVTIGNINQVAKSVGNAISNAFKKIKI
jgi:hypothetical protein